MRPKDFPMLLTHVCHRWREVATSSPLLWNRLEVRVPEDIGYNPSSRSQAFFFFQHWLERSRSAPLTISLSSPSRLYNSREEDVSDAFCGLYFQALLQHSARIRDLTIHIRHTPSPFRHGSPLVSSGVLRNLTIRTDSIWSSADILPFLSAASSQTIRSVALILPQFLSTQDGVTLLPSTTLPWSHLTDLTIDERVIHNGVHPTMDCGPVLDVLEQCRKLVNLSITLRQSRGDGDDPRYRPGVNMPHLRSFSISWLDSEWRGTLVTLLGNISCPVIETFSALNDHPHDFHVNDALFLDFLTRYSATLRSLTMPGTYDYRLIFRAVPNLKYLALANVDRPEWIESLARDQPPPLEELVLLNTHEQFLSIARNTPASFFSVIRYNPPAWQNLRVLRLNPCFWRVVLDVQDDHPEQTTVKSMLEDCRKQGLQLYVEGTQYERPEQNNCDREYYYCPSTSSLHTDHKIFSGYGNPRVFPRLLRLVDQAIRIPRTVNCLCIIA